MSDTKSNWTAFLTGGGTLTVIGVIIKGVFDRWTNKPVQQATIRQLDIAEDQLSVQQKHVEIDREAAMREQARINFDEVVTLLNEVKVSNAQLKVQVDGLSSTVASQQTQIAAQQTQITALVEDNKQLQKQRNATLVRCRSLEKQVDILKRENADSKKKVADLEHLLEQVTSPSGAH